MTDTELDTGELRKAANAIYIAVDFEVAEDISNKFKAAADEIDNLRAHIKRHTCKHWDHDELECGD